MVSSKINQKLGEIEMRQKHKEGHVNQVLETASKLQQEKQQRTKSSIRLHNKRIIEVDTLGAEERNARV